VARPRKQKSPREVQVCFNAIDHKERGGFVRSITASDKAWVPELREQMLQLQARAKSLTREQIEAALSRLRDEFVNKAAASERAGILKERKCGLFAPRQLSPELACIVGENEMAFTEVTKVVWKYIRDRGLYTGRVITPDQPLALVTQAGPFDMLELGRFLQRHLGELQPQPPPPAPLQA